MQQNKGSWAKPSVYLFLGLSLAALSSKAQERVPITLSKAIDIGIRNYPYLKAKQNYLNAAQALTRNARNEYLPNVIASLQQNYGTINAQFGPLGAVGTLGVSSSGPFANQQSWNAAFGGLYLVSTNWEVYTFGRVHSRVQLSVAQEKRDSADLEQETFVHRIKISGSYLNLLIAKQLVESGKSNLVRAQAVHESVRARAKSGLNAGVDSSLTKAEVSGARLSLIEFVTNEQTGQRQLAELLGISTTEILDPDTALFTKIPRILTTRYEVHQNPQLRFYRTRVDYADQLSATIQKSILPGVTLFGVYQARASGFSNSYNPESLVGYNKGYWDGVNPSRYNYVAGVSLSWNMISPIKIGQQVNAQRFIEAGYQNEYEQLDQQLQNQLILSDQKINNTLQSLREVPVQFKAASEAYIQKSVLYKNGLTTIVDLQQALYILNRAEIDLRVANINVWLALLQKAAASGDFDLFINQAQ
jgi:outer membrane protein TolC